MSLSAEKSVQYFKKGNGLHAATLKLKNERTQFQPQALLCRAQTKSRNPPVSKKIVGWVSRLWLHSGEYCIGRGRDRFPGLEAEDEIFRDLPDIVRGLRVTSQAIEGMIDPDGVKEQDAIIGPETGVESNVAEVGGYEVIVPNSSVRTIG